MVVLYILGALLLLIICIMLIRVGVYVSFGGELCVRIKLGPVTKQIIPKAEKPKKPEKPKKEKKKKKEKKEKEKQEESPKEKKKPNLTFEDIRSAIPVVVNALKKAIGRAGRRLRIDPMRLTVVFGNDDPAKTAEMFGWGCSAMWTLMPRLEQHARMPDPRIHLDVDYNARQTRAEGEIAVSLLIWDGVVIVMTLAIPVFKWFLATRREKKAARKAAMKSNYAEDQNKGE